MTLNPKWRERVSFAIPRIVAAGLLFWALAEHPYGYYTFLRWMVFGTAAYCVFQAFERNHEIWLYIFGVIAVLFNPFIPIHLTRQIWAPIDVVTALLFLVSIVLIPARKAAPKTG